MWLQKDERRLLVGYYRVIGEIDKAEGCHVSDLRGLLKRRAYTLEVPENDKKVSDFANKKEMERWAKKYHDETNRVKRANKHLHERGLISLEHHEHELNMVLITLTLEGYDLGRKYTGFLTRSGLWFEEYRNHWLWLIIAFFGGVIGTKLLDLILARMASGKIP
jgi:hypothetical protein